MAEHTPALDGAATGHELRDLDAKKIGLFGAALTAIIIAALLASYALLHYFYVSVTRARPQPSPLSFSREPTPEPRLLVKPGVDLQAMRAEESKILESYEWVDRDKGIVRIPIARAIEIIAQKGLPVRNEKKETAAVKARAPQAKGTKSR